LTQTNQACSLSETCRPAQHLDHLHAPANQFENVITLLIEIINGLPADFKFIQNMPLQKRINTSIGCILLSETAADFISKQICAKPT